MSIARLKHVALAGLASERERVLEDLQRLGCVELLPRRADAAAQGGEGPATEVREALNFLLGCPERRRQFADDPEFDPLALQARALALRDRLLALHEALDELHVRAELLAPWGEFEFPPLAALDGLRLWFYRVPHHRMGEFAEIAEPWETVRRDHAHCYVVVVAAHEPEDTPVPRERLGPLSRLALAHRLQQLEIDIEAVQEERAQLTHWCTLLARNLATLEDAAARRTAAAHTCAVDPLFGFDAWVPAERLETLQAYAKANALVLEVRDPALGEQPPTKLENPSFFSPGEGLVNFYMTPGYWTWDPSATVLLSFAVFFAMILADAGYALLLGAGLCFTWRRLGGSPGGDWFRRVTALCLALATGYGMLIGSYFGLAPRAGSALATLQRLDVGDSAAMMTLSIGIGVLHMIYAALRDGLRYGLSTRALAPLGWAAALGGGALFASARLLGFTGLEPSARVLLGTGLVLVLLFSAAGAPPLRRLLAGGLALTRATAAFGDALSYLRLFALGLASASLAGAFNTMAAGMRESMPGTGLFLALLVLLLGHALNILLGLASAVIHGLRLNVIEFFNWGLTEEGRQFRPLRNKES